MTEHKKTEFILQLVLWVLLCGLSVWFCTLCDPWKENLTGLAWIRCHQVACALYALLACVLNGWLSFRALNRYGEKKQAKISVLLWAMMAAGALLPWAPEYASEAASVTGSLHLLLCSASFFLQLILWSRIWFSPISSSVLRKLAGSVLAASLFCLGILGISQCVSLVCEIAYACLIPAVLLFYKTNAR